MIVHISSGFIPHVYVESFLEHILNNVVPALLIAPDLVSIQTWRRLLPSYEEIATVTVWRSDECLQGFLNSKREIWAYEKFAAVNAESRSYELEDLL